MFRSLLRRAAHFKFYAPSYGRRFASQTPGRPGTPSVLEQIRGRLDRWTTRSPKFFKPTLRALRDAPASYILSFAVVHELTAVVPLGMLFWWFHHYQWLPAAIAEGRQVIEGVERFGRYFRKKGWIEDKEEARIEEETEAGRAKQVQKRVSRFGNKDEVSGRMLVELATAYAIVKLLLPLRIVLSVWWAPACARTASRTLGLVLGWAKKAG